MAQNLVFFVALLLNAGACYRYTAVHRNWLERGILAGAAVLVEAAVAANILSVIGFFSLWGISVSLGCLAVVPILLCHKKEKAVTESGKMQGWDRMAVMLLAVIFCLCFFFPVKYFLAGRDPGVYLINGVHIAKTGSITYESDEWLDEHYEEVKDIVDLDYPGYYSEYEYGLSEKPGKVVTQFLHMYPSVLAIGYEMAGIEGLVRVNAILCVFALGVIYCMARRMFSDKAACISLLFLTVNPAQIWSGRITQSEILSQLILFLGIWLFYEGWDKGERKYALWAGVLFGISTFNRIDAYIIGAGILLTLGYCEMFDVKRKYAWQAAGIYLSMAMLSLAYGFTFSYPYYRSHLDKGLLAVLFLNLGLLAADLLLMCIRFIRGRKKGPVWEWKLSIWVQGIGSLVIPLILGALGGFAYVFRPLLFRNMEKASERYAMQQFCWYTTVAAILFMLYGMFRIFRKNAYWERYLLFLSVALTNLVIYIYRPSISADHIWMSRRWIFICIPSVLILAGYGIACIRLKKEKLTRMGQGAVLILIAGIFLNEDKVFLWEKMYDGMDRQYEEADAQLEDNKIYVTKNTSIAGIYRCIYGKHVYLLADQGAELAKYAEGYEVYYLGNPGELDPFCVEVREEKEILITGNFLEKSTQHFPKSLYKELLNSSVSRLGPSSRSEIEMDLSDLSLGEQSRLEEEGIVCEGEGYALWGPYMNLEAGNYRVEFDLETESEGKIQGSCQVAVNGGEVLEEKEIKESGTIILEIQSKEKLTGVEFRIEKGIQTLICKSIRLSKED